jgi:hypothetical protein
MNLRNRNYVLGEVVSWLSEGVPEDHQKKIALKTLKMSKVGAQVMGGPGHAESVKILLKSGMSRSDIGKLLRQYGHSDDDIKGFMK